MLDPVRIPIANFRIPSSFKHRLGDEVRISAIDRPGIVTGLLAEAEGPQYRIAYWWDGVRHSVWAHGSEIEGKKVERIQKPIEGDETQAGHEVRVRPGDKLILEHPGVEGRAAELIQPGDPLMYDASGEVRPASWKTVIEADRAARDQMKETEEEEVARREEEAEMSPATGLTEHGSRLADRIEKEQAQRDAGAGPRVAPSHSPEVRVLRAVAEIFGVPASGHVKISGWGDGGVPTLLVIRLWRKS